MGPSGNHIQLLCWYCVFLFILVIDIDSEWFDEQAGLLRPYTLLYFNADQTLEIHDLKKRAVFLKRQAYPSISLQDIFPGNSVLIYSRQFKIIKYGDARTAAAFAEKQSRSLVLLGPEATVNTGVLLDYFSKAQISIAKLKMCQLSPDDAAKFLGLRSTTVSAQSISKGPVVCISAVGADVQSCVAEVSRISQAGSSEFFVSQDARGAELEHALIFENRNVLGTATFDSCTTCVIKPHAIKSGSIYLPFV